MGVRINFVIRFEKMAGLDTNFTWMVERIGKGKSGKGFRTPDLIGKLFFVVVFLCMINCRLIQLVAAGGELLCLMSLTILN